jgi:hypothetical protein
MLFFSRYLVSLFAAGCFVLVELMISSNSAQIYDPELRLFFEVSDLCGTDYSRGSADGECTLCVLGDPFCGWKGVWCLVALQLHTPGTAWRSLPILGWSIGYERLAVRGPPCFAKGDIDFIAA